MPASVYEEGTGIGFCLQVFYLGIVLSGGFCFLGFFCCFLFFPPLSNVCDNGQDWIPTADKKSMEYFTHEAEVTNTEAWSCARDIEQKIKPLSLWTCTKTRQLAIQRKLTGCTIFQPFRKKWSAILVGKFRQSLAWFVTDTRLVKAHFLFEHTHWDREEKKHI